MRQHLRSERVKLPRVHRVSKNGKVFKYHKVTRAPLPRDVPEDHPTFMAAWIAEEAKKPHERPRAATGSIADGIARYLRSPQYKALSKEYAATIHRNVQAIYHAYGEAPMSRLGPEHIDRDLGKLVGNHRVARRKAWRQLGAFWKDESYVTSDPSETAMRVKAPKGEGHRAWSADQIAAYREKHPIGSVARLCFELLFWTAARTVDGVALGPRQIGRDGLLTFVQSKTKGEAYVPWTSSLPDWGTDMEEDRQMLMQCLSRKTFTFLEAQGGKPRTKKGLSNLVSKAARDAGIEGRSAHGLRRSRLTILAENGASVHAIMAWGGHKTLSEAQRYIDEADRKRALKGTERDQNTVNQAVSSGKLSK